MTKDSSIMIYGGKTIIERVKAIVCLILGHTRQPKIHICDNDKECIRLCCKRCGMTMASGVRGAMFIGNREDISIMEREFQNLDNQTLNSFRYTNEDKKERDEDKDC